MIHEQADNDPLFWPLADAIASVGRAEGLLPEAYNHLLGSRVNAVGPPVRFEAMVKTRRARRPPPALAYDGRITTEQVIPTRPENLHDFLNALVWASFPRAKRALHDRQYRAAEVHGSAPHRSADQDQLTQLDEGGVIVACMAARERELACVLDTTPPPDARDLGNLPSVRVAIFGHAIYEHLLTQTSAVRAYAVLLVDPAWESGAPSAESIDVLLARHLRDHVPKASGSLMIRACRT